MPVMNGNMATAEIRRIERENGIYPDSDDMQNHNLQRRRSLIYALTGLASDQDKKLAFDCGVDGFLTKPVSLRILADILDRYFPNTTAPFNPTAKSPGTPMSSTSTPLLPKQSKKTLELPRAAEKKVDGAVA
ncbi:hypothetical protein BC936DRAFT_140540 [Jimgerdemannia flammicorona]|uniref:histidine kinase n=1 Tax=Jimgerdemannia flammicorona TaxID=994334 RepID=A0A433APJ7_9FUNG|nr:hypothetical protein BC936DRAFT_140540 [Jimgerdemannia flammicorona]